MKIEGIIFDMDGTLVDSMWIWGDLPERFLRAEKNIEPPEGLGELFKNMTFESASYYTAENFPVNMSPEEIRSAWLSMVFGYYEKDLKLKAGAKEYLENCKANGMKLALATSNFKSTAEVFLKQNEVFSLFDVIITSDEVGKNKEHPDIYLKAAQSMGIKPEHCMVFEDILIAVKTAKNAGMTVVAVEDEASSAEWEEIKRTADKYIQSFYDI